jgi:ABC-2 type transport system permease protein
MTQIKYPLLRLVRNKSNIFWILLFPIILGCLFKIAFSNLGNAESFHPIPVAIVSDDSEAAQNFCLVADELAKEGTDQMLVITYCTKEEALALLEEKDVDGILFAADPVSLTISGEMNNAQMNQSILKTLVEEYNLNASIAADTAAVHPELLPRLIAAMSEAQSYHEEISLSRSAGDMYTQYFYNLIAMACLYTALSGIIVSAENQANMTCLAARKSISPTGKSGLVSGELAANVLFEFVLNLIAFLFMIFVLGIDMTARFPWAVLTIFVSTVTGVSFGFFLGALGPKTEGGKIGMMFAIVMPCCFLSGLMIGNMRILVEQYAPWLNRINPAALISDCFYSLNVYESMDRYTGNILTLLLLSIIFCLTGFVATRRKKYASL